LDLDLVASARLSKKAHAVPADLLQRVGRTAEACAAVDRAIELCGNDVERELLERRRRTLSSAAH
jgi:RNA polymerase sigma-70 factor (ECF subfamily)